MISAESLLYLLAAAAPTSSGMLIEDDQCPAVSSDETSFLQRLKKKRCENDDGCPEALVQQQSSDIRGLGKDEAKSPLENWLSSQPRPQEGCQSEEDCPSEYQLCLCNFCLYPPPPGRASPVQPQSSSLLQRSKSCNNDDDCEDIRLKCEKHECVSNFPTPICSDMPEWLCNDDGDCPKRWQCFKKTCRSLSPHIPISDDPAAEQSSAASSVQLQSSSMLPPAKSCNNDDDCENSRLKCEKHECVSNFPTPI